MFKIIVWLEAINKNILIHRWQPSLRDPGSIYRSADKKQRFKFVPFADKETVLLDSKQQGAVKVLVLFIFCGDLSSDRCINCKLFPFRVVVYIYCLMKYLECSECFRVTIVFVWRTFSIGRIAEFRI